MNIKTVSKNAAVVVGTVAVAMAVKRYVLPAIVKAVPATAKPLSFVANFIP